MSAHTPGPWTLETVRTSCGLCHKVGPFPWKQGKENYACVYDDYPGFSGGTPELVANARLIAAAPELYEALKAAAQSAGFQYMMFETRDLIDNAIAKAEGTS